jgi:hypothetical protein
MMDNGWRWKSNDMEQRHQYKLQSLLFACEPTNSLNWKVSNRERKMLDTEKLQNPENCENYNLYSSG